MNRCCTAPGLILAAVLGLANSSPAAEPWADSELEVRDGLELWLDAGRQAAARKARSLPELANDGRLDLWLDASGRGRDVTAPTPDARPVFASIAGTPVVRFDGVDDHLRGVDQPGELRSFSIYLVVVPRSNAGGFRAFLALNAHDQRDWMSGLTVDQGPGPGTVFGQLNVEGRGFLGAQNLMNQPHLFDTAHVVLARSDTAARNVLLVVDNVGGNKRVREDEPLSMEELTIGARFYTNEPAPQIARGFVDADIAEVLVYNRALNGDEMRSVNDYLERKYKDLKAASQPDEAGEPLVAVENPPAVQVLAPGFEVRRLPLDLPNINNVRTRPDGKVMALAYNGDIYLLSDTDGDGLEDHYELFWDNQGSLRAPIGMTLTPPGYAKGQGAFVAAKGKCSLIVDTNGDDRADKEIVIADGWKEIPHGVDSLGTAIDPRDGSVYFGIAVTNFTNPYLVEADGTSKYSAASERGAILRVSPDFQSREIICSGIRFPVAMGFDSHGELFCTEQEGATWLVNGNPFDELLHIERGRHYGFPPRHPKHLPDAIDEPSVYDYGPQHQCTCGLFFNEPVSNDDPVFGPRAWRGDALVAGYSRGKIYRTSLTKTAAGYVARNQLLACLNELTVDQCADREGRLLVATHSGGPDWGSGPGGNGKLYKIRYRDAAAPQPVAVWSAAPDEIQIAFDRPLDPERLKGIASQCRIQAGPFVRAGDRFETVRPGYAAVGAQIISPRKDLPVHSVQVSPDGRTLLLVSPPSAGRVPHAVTLPASMFGDVPEAKDVVEQHPQVDLDYDLTGVAAKWSARDGGAAWNGWLPHSDLAVAAAFTRESASHDALWPHLKQAGTLTLTTLVDLEDMLRPAVQPGAKIDYTWPDETTTLTFHGSAPVTLTCSEGRIETDANDPNTSRLVVKSTGLKPFPIQIAMATGDRPATLEVTWSTNEDPRPRAFPLRRFFVPWSEDARASVDALVKKLPPELEGGSWARGRQVFFGEVAGCHKCHNVGGKGSTAAPNLSNLIHRDYASVLRDVTEPSFAINPDYATYLVEDTSGRVWTGTVRGDGENVRITDQKGQEQVLPKSEVERVVPGKISTMPTGLPAQIGAERMKDLLTFLLTAPPQMPQDGPGPAPPARKRAEVEAVLAGAPDDGRPTRDLRITLVAGPKDHGPGEHDYPAWQKSWLELLRAMDRTDVTTAWGWPEKDDIEKSDVLVFYQQGSWTDDKAKDIDAFLARGGGLVYLHYAVDGGKQPADFARRIGLAWIGGGSKFRHGPLDLAFNRGSKHPIARNFDGLHLVDESYWQLVGSLPQDQVIASGVEDGEPQPLFWTTEPDKGRVFVSIPGHYSWTFDDPLFRILILRGIAWTAKEPVDRFNEAVWLGSQVSE